MKEQTYCVVLTTTDNEEKAEALAKKIVSAKLGACVQVTGIKSFYMWKGEACSEPEFLLIIKARTEQYDDLQSFIKANHSYETPEIIQLPVSAGHPSYLTWINEVTGA